MVKKDRNVKERNATLSRNSQLDVIQKKVAEEIAYKGFTGKKEEEIALEYNVNRVIMRLNSKYLMETIIIRLHFLQRMKN